MGRQRYRARRAPSTSARSTAPHVARRPGASSGSATTSTPGSSIPARTGTTRASPGPPVRDASATAARHSTRFETGDRRMSRSRSTSSAQISCNDTESPRRRMSTPSTARRRSMFLGNHASHGSVAGTVRVGSVTSQRGRVDRPHGRTASGAGPTLPGITFFHVAPNRHVTSAPRPRECQDIESFHVAPNRAPLPIVGVSRPVAGPRRRQRRRRRTSVAVCTGGDAATTAHDSEQRRRAQRPTPAAIRSSSSSGSRFGASVNSSRTAALARCARHPARRTDSEQRERCTTRPALRAARRSRLSR